VALALCALGIAWRALSWLRVRIGPDARAATPGTRLGAALRGIAAALLSRRVVRVLGSLLADAVVLRRLWAASRARWLAHLLIVVGFTVLLLGHALAPVVTVALDPGYQPTLGPYLLLRNACGAMVLGGIALLLVARWRTRAVRPPPRERAAAAFVALLALVIVSGFALEAHKIASPRAFDRMAEQFVGADQSARLAGLRALWAREFGVAFAGAQTPLDPARVESGRELHRDACAPCHDRPAFAFVSYPVARMMAPVTARLDGVDAERWLLDLHVLACLVGLATLPFTRFVHVVASPLGLLARATARHRGHATPAPSIAGVANRRALALDACVRCGLCDLDCSVAPLARLFDNRYLLPSHKLVATGAMARGRSGFEPGTLALELAAEGAAQCTDCGRCTARCPVGLDLADLWRAGRGDLAVAGLATPALRLQAHPELALVDAGEPDCPSPGPTCEEAALAPLATDRRGFSRCVQCQTCTNVCPVVAHGTGGEGAIDLTPQRVMNLLRLGLPELALGSRMVWSCATCYQCQQHCPEGIRVTDIICELRGLAVARLRSAGTRKEPA
jgi:heterodisulfide reductase subunit C/nitrate reductase gamma subunit